MAQLDLLGAARKEIDATANPARAAAVLRAVPGARTNGAAVPALRARVASFRKQHGLASEEAFAVCDALCSDGTRESLLFAFFLIGSYQRACAGVPWPRLERWLSKVDNWETCDQLAMAVGAVRVAADAETGIDQLKRFARSDDMWRRRFALATGASLNQKGRFFPGITLQVCQMLLADAEPMIQKSIGWAVRELSKKDAEVAFGFLADNRDAIKPRTLREAAEKLPAVLRDRLQQD